MTAPDFAQFLKLEEEALAAQLRSVRAAITHPGEKGRGLEQQALALLRRFLPGEYGLTTGFVACAEPQEDGTHRVALSRQNDIVIYDAIRGAPLVDLSSCQVLPLECVHAVVDVKASLVGSTRDIYAWSSAVRRLTTRHLTFDPERTVNPHAEQEDALERSLAALGAGDPRRSVQLWGLPRHVAIDWLPVRCFAIAFEYGAASFDLDVARGALADAFEDPGHLHAVFIPDVCVLWNERADEDATRLGTVGGSTDAPLATFRHRLLDALANSPRAREGTTMDLRPYFGGRVVGRPGPVVIVPRH